MKILVCIGNVPDTTTKIKFDTGMQNLDTNGVQWVINPWDELALTRALEIKEQSAGKIEKVSAINVGLVNSEPTIRKALAIGADDAFRIDCEPSDSYTIAAQIAEVAKNENYDIIFSGIESSDFNAAAVGSMIAEFMDIASVSAVSSFEFNDGDIILKREIDGGKETVKIQTPFVAIVQKGICINPRIPAMRGIMMAKTKPIKVSTPVSVENLAEALSFEVPPAKAECKMIDAEETDLLIELLHSEAKVL
ncbi:MAG: electron transfer flavoprotein subunit beta/FixA family protein [Bacteroidales bacterium]|jgi:electron transfer flavoprotein beta subunit|nr:electron transfer flavoprotein subunit beta/FixA family protein [Bacteroidales bacterium]MDY0314725.1 electron transfer flavoprotein subunit beta/FixA family protein [Bacteroidales bacterium]NLB86557.1 electron transfer flavoprotein subunit beta/FixA family protein [Bacteroidales bacterium]